MWDRGFRRNSSLQAVWDSRIARTTGFMWPDQGWFLFEGNKFWQLWNSVSVQIRSMRLRICMRPYLYWLDVILFTAIWRGRINDHELHILSQMYNNLAEYCITWAVGYYFNLYMSRRTFFQPFHHQVMSDDDIQDPDITWAVGHSF